MSRRIRIKGPGLYHHIFNRGNDKHPIFKGRDDYKCYLKYLKKCSIKHDIDVIAYALMMTHIHLFVYDRRGEISRFVEYLHGQYAKRYNGLYGRTGHVFGSRFKNKIIDANKYGIWLSRYIHRQSVEAHINVTPDQYEWTSYPVYIGKQKDGFIKQHHILGYFGESEAEKRSSYKSFVDGTDCGPIDWKAMENDPRPIIADRFYADYIKEKTGWEGRVETAHDDVLNIVCFQLEVSIDDLIAPVSMKEKSLRNKAIHTLHRDYGHGVREIARLLKLSPGYVWRLLNKGQ